MLVDRDGDGGSMGVSLYLCFAIFEDQTQNLASPGAGDRQQGFFLTALHLSRETTTQAPRYFKVPYHLTLGCN